MLLKTLSRVAIHLTPCPAICIAVPCCCHVHATCRRQRKPTGRVQSAVKAAEEAISPHQVSEESSTPRAKRTPAKRPRPSPQQKAKQPEGSELPGASDAGGDGSAAGLADAVKGADRVSVQAPPKPKRTPQPAQCAHMPPRRAARLSKLHERMPHREHLTPAGAPPLASHRRLLPPLLPRLLRSATWHRCV